jgi:hypothetical protein
VSHPGRNRNGQSCALTVLTPIVRGQESELAGHLDALPTGDASPLARVPGTHIARWVLVDDVVYEGAGQKRDALRSSRLLFTSNHDGDPDAYMEALASALRADADAIWGHCVGYPGSGSPRAFAAWLRAHAIESSLFFAAYGDQTLAQVRSNLDSRARVMEFALRAQGLGPEDLQREFRAAFGA